MKLLFDQNLSPSLVGRLADVYSGSVHVSELGLGEADDLVVWHYSRENGYLIVSKDSDFNEISLMHGFPPKVIWIRRGNCKTRDIEALLRRDFDQIEKLAQSEQESILILF
ncbi:MAG: DUF5615 family PIN-like protein [Rhodothermales bacterium]|nr:DUF5615 family PIN-like protein [Rhodothermales bacterium]